MSENMRVRIVPMTADHLDAVSGASSSGKNFNKLAAAVLEKAKKGDTSIAIVEVESEGE